MNLKHNQNIITIQKLKIPKIKECIFINKEKEEDIIETNFNINVNSIIDFSSIKISNY